MPATDSYVAPTPPSRKVLIFQDDEPIRNLLGLAVKKLGRKNGKAANGEPALATISRKEFDAVVLDLRCSNLSQRSKDGVGVIKEIQHSLVGRVLAMTVEVSDPKSLELVERYVVSGLPRSLLWLVSDQ